MLSKSTAVHSGAARRIVSRVVLGTSSSPLNSVHGSVSSSSGEQYDDHLLLKPTSVQTRSYISRAHPRDIPKYALPEAIEKVNDHMEVRKKKAEARWEKYADWRKKSGKPDDGTPYRHLVETMELAVNLNVDPRKPGQSLRGTVELPHGTGKRINCVVFTTDEDLVKQAQEAGALHVGGEDLMDQIVAGSISVDSFQRTLATSEVAQTMNRKLARILGPRGLMPNAKTGTMLPSPDRVLEMLETTLAGKTVQYRTEKEGILHFPIGKGNFQPQQLLENVGVIMNEIYKIKPESYGKKKKGSKKSAGSSSTYVVSAYLTSTFGKGFQLDLRTVDPSSPYFLTHLD